VTPPSPTASRWRRWSTLSAGYTLLVVGGTMLVLPGPGLPVVIAGLALLEREEAWARRLRVRLRGHLDRLRRRRGEPAGSGQAQGLGRRSTSTRRASSLPGAGRWS
jgi:hypothetical protein